MKFRFRFTIREILLATTAVAALLALARTYWKDSQPLHRTALTDQHFIPTEVEQFAKAKGFSRHFSHTGGGSGSAKFHQSIRSGKYSFDLPRALHDNLVHELRQSILDKIAAGGCRIRGRSSGSHWEVSYGDNSMDGVVELMTASEYGESDRLHVMFFAIEIKKQSGAR